MLFASLALGCFGLYLLLMATFTVKAHMEGVEFAPLAMVAIALWPTGVTLAILGLVFDRRHNWVSRAALVANILAPVIFAASTWLIAHMTRWF